MLITYSDRWARCYYEHAKRSETSELQGSRDITTTAALHCRCVSRDDKSSWKPDRFERAVARNYEAPIFPTASNQTSHVLRPAWFRARFSYSYWSPGASPSSWSPRLDFLRIRLEETINHLVMHGRSAVREHFYLTAVTAVRTFWNRHSAQ